MHKFECMEVNFPDLCMYVYKSRPIGAWMYKEKIIII